MNIRVAIITLSDKGSKGEREDESGRAIHEMIAGMNARVVHYEVLPDEKQRIIEVLSRLSDSGAIDLIITTGGTGVSARDVTPEATQAVIDRALPGMAEAMRAESLKKTPRAMISRAVVDKISFAHLEYKIAIHGIYLSAAHFFDKKTIAR